MLLTILANNVMIAPVVPPKGGSGSDGGGKQQGSVNYLLEQQRARTRLIRQEDEEIFNIIKAFIECSG